MAAGRFSPRRWTRWLQLYGKKRRGRRTRGAALGTAAQLAMFLVFFVAGAAMLGLMLTMFVLPEWRVNHQFRQTEAEIRDRRLLSNRNPQDSRQLLYRPEFKVRYEVGGNIHETWTYDLHPVFLANRAQQEDKLQEFRVGQRYPCWYDPAQPEVAVLVRGYSWVAWLMLILPGSFLTIGGTGLVYTLVTWGRSAERRAAQAAALPWDLLEPTADAGGVHPCVPDGRDITDSAGTTLRYRLSLDHATTWHLMVAAVVAVTVNGASALFLTMAVRRYLRGEPDWALTLFIIPWLAVGIGSLYYLARQVLLAVGVGNTLVEISDFPLVPGGRYEVLVSQAGRLRMNTLRLLLACEERATFQQGTNTRTHRRRVVEREVLRRDQFEITPVEPFEARTALELPGNAMHSFQSEHNEIAWSLIVQGDVAGWPNFERRFHIVVSPVTEEHLAP